MLIPRGLISTVRGAQICVSHTELVGKGKELQVIVFVATIHPQPSTVLQLSRIRGLNALFRIQLESHSAKIGTIFIKEQRRGNPQRGIFAVAEYKRVAISCAAAHDRNASFDDSTTHSSSHCHFSSNAAWIDRMHYLGFIEETMHSGVARALATARRAGNDIECVFADRLQQQ